MSARHPNKHAQEEEIKLRHAQLHQMRTELEQMRQRGARVYEKYHMTASEWEEFWKKQDKFTQEEKQLIYEVQLSVERFVASMKALVDSNPWTAHTNPPAVKKKQGRPSGYKGWIPME